MLTASPGHFQQSPGRLSASQSSIRLHFRTDLNIEQRYISEQLSVCVVSTISAARFITLEAM